MANTLYYIIQILFLELSRISASAYTFIFIIISNNNKDHSEIDEPLDFNENMSTNLVLKVVS